MASAAEDEVRVMLHDNPAKLMWLDWPRTRIREHGGHDMGTTAEELRAIRENVRALCQDFPDTYWRDIDKKEAYPQDFVKALTESGYLAALIPEEYGGVGTRDNRGRRHPRRDQPFRGQFRRLPRPDVHDGNACCATAATNRSSVICRRSPGVSYVCRRLLSPSRTLGQRPHGSRPARSARETVT